MRGGAAVQGLTTGEREPRTLLLITGGPEAAPAIAEARRLGLRVLVVDGVPNAPAFRLADAGLLASPHDPDAAVDAARAYAARRRIDGVLAVTPDVPLSAAAVAAALGLPGVALDVAQLGVDRVALLARLQAAGVAVPRAAAVPGAAALADLAARAVTGLVVRPADGRGDGGVVHLLPGVDPRWAYEVAVARSPTGRVMAEAYVPGPQARTESVVVGGRVVPVGISDREHAGSERFVPFLVETGRTFPSALPAAARAAITAAVSAGVAALGIAAGVVQATVAIGREGPVVLGLAARPAGGLSCTHEVPLATGVNLLGASIRLALGEAPHADDLAPRWSRAVARRCVFPAPGRVTGVEGAEEAAAGEGVVLVQLRVAVGDRVARPTRAAVVIAVGETGVEAMARADAAAARVRVLTRAEPGARG